MGPVKLLPLKSSFFKEVRVDKAAGTRPVNFSDDGQRCMEKKKKGEERRV
jgi:hypothetical protein